MGSKSFLKLQASGNDFILLDYLTGSKKSKKFYQDFAKQYCCRKFAIGADGVLVIEPGLKGRFKMRIFNADGSEAEMCGNGARCTALWAVLRLKNKKSIEFDTKAGVIKAQVSSLYKKAGSGRIKISMSKPFGTRLDLPVTISGRRLKVNYINTGVPHSVVLTEGLEKIDIDSIGRQIRFHREFKPKGTNVDFIEVSGEDSVNMRTYERGVEAETLACGTGAVASAVIAVLRSGLCAGKKDKIVKVKTKSGEVLNIYFSMTKGRIENVCLQGQAYLVYEGKVNIT